MKIAIIGGTGMQQVEGFELIQENSVDSGITLYEGTLNGQPVWMLPRHAKGHKVPPHQIDHHAHIRALKAHGVNAVLATAAVGSLRTDWNTGTLCVLSDFLDFMRQVYTFYDQEVVHTDFSQPFSPALRTALIESAHAEEIPVQTEGVYVCAPGPRYETPAEIRMYRMLGGDVVGMTVAPEAALCREAGIQYAAIAGVTNLGTGLSPHPLGHDEVTEAMSIMQRQIARIFSGVIRQFHP